MSISPYDQLPTGTQEPSEAPAGYVEVPLETLQETEEQMPPEANEQNITPAPCQDPQPEPAPQPSQIQQQETMQHPKDSSHCETPLPETSPSAANPPHPQPQSAAQPQNETQPQPELPAQLLPQTQPLPSTAKTVPMEHPPQYQPLSIKNLAGTAEYIMSFEESLLVPDIMPDIKNILFTEADVHLSQPQKSSYEKNDTLSGEIIFYTIYEPDNSSESPVEVITSTIPFKTDRCWGNFSDTFIQLQVSVKSTTAKLANERKLMAQGEVRICFTRITAAEIPVYHGCDDPDFVPLERTITLTEATQNLSETTEISQEITLKDDQPQPIRILRESFRIIENHRQITSGKLVLNGTIHTDLLYLGDHEEQPALCEMHHKTDFTQFILIQGEPDMDLIQTGYTAENLHCTLQSPQELLLQGQILTQVQLYENRQIPMIQDAYHKTQQLRFDRSQQPLHCICDSASGEISAREVIDLDDTSQIPVSLQKGFCRLQNISAKAEQSRIVIEGTLQIMLLAISEDGHPFTVPGSIPLRGALDASGFSAPADCTADTLDADLTADIKDFWFDSINTRQIELNASVILKSRSCAANRYQTIHDPRFAESSGLKRHIALALYMTAPEDTLWKIAKRYQIDTDALIRLNQLSPDLPADAPVPENTKLLIMKS